MLDLFYFSKNAVKIFDLIMEAELAYSHLTEHVNITWSLI